MNLYQSLAEFKEEVGIPQSDTVADAWFLRLLERASRMVDRYAGFPLRHFYAWEGTKTFIVEGSSTALFVPDLISVASLMLDSKALTEGTDADFILTPLNNEPKTLVYRIGTYWPAKTQVEITGVWGFSADTEATGVLVPDTEIDDFQTLIELGEDEGEAFSPGQTLRIDSEQMYVVSVTGDTLQVERGVNGTEQAIHDLETPIRRYTYPPEVVQATFIQALRWYRGRDAAWGNEGGMPPATTGAGMDIHMSVKSVLNPLRRVSVL